MNGVIVVDKPSGWTSHDVVNKTRRIAGTKKVGHLGTLDPAATGVLPLLIDRATRMAQFFSENTKTYEATVRFGQATTTYDAEGEPVGEAVAVAPALEELERVLAAFHGTFMQTPPPVSAKKIQGQPAYKLARKNIEFELPPVEVTVHALELLGLDGAELRLRVKCSAGTYLRSIAHDAGQRMGCGAHLSALRRTQSGPFLIEQARTLEELTALGEAGRLREALVPAAELLPELPLEMVDRLTESQIRQGRDFRVSPFRDRGNTTKVKAVSEDGELVAIGELRVPNVYHPILVL